MAKDFEDELYEIALSLALDTRNEFDLTQATTAIYTKLVYAYNCGVVEFLKEKNQW